MTDNIFDQITASAEILGISLYTAGLPKINASKLVKVKRFNPITKRKFGVKRIDDNPIEIHATPHKSRGSCLQLLR